MKRFKSGMGIAIACVLVLSTAAWAAPKFISIATGGTGGAYFPIGGSRALRDGFAEAVRRRGGELERSRPVERILVEGGRACGVRTRDGEEVRAGVVVSNVDATVTYRDGSEGLIVYVKASLTGHEPADVLQYHATHPDFPHETTADQFFDEAQWESYRRLGECVGEAVLRTRLVELADRVTTLTGVP